MVQIVLLVLGSQGCPVCQDHLSDQDFQLNREVLIDPMNPLHQYRPDFQCYP